MCSALSGGPGNSSTCSVLIFLIVCNTPKPALKRSARGFENSAGVLEILFGSVFICVAEWIKLLVLSAGKLPKYIGRILFIVGKNTNIWNYPFVRDN